MRIPEQQHVVAGGSAGGGLINDGLASGSSLPGKGGGVPTLP
jgi:hypothetical protein